jgi:hypothetical protein
MALLESSEVFGLDFLDRPLIDFAVRYNALADQLPGPSAGKGVAVVVVVPLFHIVHGEEAAKGSCSL